MKKAFTLVEMVTVIAVIAVISLLTIPKIIGTIQDNNLKLYKEMENRLEDAAIKYCIENSCSSGTSINITTLVSNGYVSEVKDLTDDTTCTGTVTITIGNTTTASANIVCSNYETE